MAVIRISVLFLCEHADCDVLPSSPRKQPHAEPKTPNTPGKMREPTEKKQSQGFPDFLSSHWAFRERMVGMMLSEDEAASRSLALVAYGSLRGRDSISHF